MSTIGLIVPFFGLYLQVKSFKTQDSTADNIVANKPLGSTVISFVKGYIYFWFLRYQNR